MGVLEESGHSGLQADGGPTTGMKGRVSQSSPRVARESWGLRSSHRRAEETSPRRVSGRCGRGRGGEKVNKPIRVNWRLGAEVGERLVYWSKETTGVISFGLFT